MPGPKHLDPELSPLHFFGAEFRRARETAGMSQGAFAATVPCDTSIVSRVEGGELAPSDAFIEATSRTFPDRDWLVRFHQASPKWSKNRPIPRWFEDYLRAEREAHTLRIWQPILIPGPFQTGEYARELFRVEQPDLDGEGLGRAGSAAAGTAGHL
jgi:hypothetical protein